MYSHDPQRTAIPRISVLTVQHRQWKNTACKPLSLPRELGTLLPRLQSCRGMDAGNQAARSCRPRTRMNCKTPWLSPRRPPRAHRSQLLAECGMWREWHNNNENKTIENRNPRLYTFRKKRQILCFFSQPNGREQQSEQSLPTQSYESWAPKEKGIGTPAREKF